MNQLVLEIFREKKSSIILILVLMILNVTLLLLISYYQEPLIADAQSKWSELRRRTASGGRGDATSLYRQGASDLEKFLAKVPAKREFARVLSDILEKASTSSVVVGKISYKPVVVKEAGLLSYQLSYSVNGGYAAVKSYLADLLNNPEIVVVENVDFTNNDLFVENVEMNLRVTVYLQGGA